jgi:hypothetical protein
MKDVHVYRSVGPRTELDYVELYGMLVEVEAPGRARTCCITCNEMRATGSFPLSDTVRVGVNPPLQLVSASLCTLASRVRGDPCGLD